MSRELARLGDGPEPPALPELPDVGDLVALFLAGRSPRTLRAYGADLDAFARFLGASTRRAATDALLAAGQGKANAMALAWRGAMTGEGLAPATIARRLAALRSLVKLARTVGQVSWTLDVDPPRHERLRDTRGPGAEGWARMLVAAEARPDGPATRRDLAIVRLLHDRALRRGELVALDLGDYDGAGRTVAVIGKGRAQRERLGIGARTSAAIARWVEARGDRPGPLFVRLDRGQAVRLARLTGESVRRIVAALARLAGLDGVRPHGLRHQAITAALDAGRDIRDVAKFSRHKDIKTVLIYDDRRRDVGGEIAEELGG